MLVLEKELVSMPTTSDWHFYVSSDDPEGDTVKLSIVAPNSSQTLSLTFGEIHGLRDLLQDAVEALFQQNDIKCPACKQTQEMATALGDHNCCRMFPFFPGETGRSLAKP